MAEYRCYLLHMGRITGAPQIIAADDDAAAVLEADRILESSPCPSAELWDRNRRVSIISRKRPVA
jgi:hypothetical protein